MDVAQAKGTGPEGRFVAADVQQLISSGGGKEAKPSEPSAPSQEQQQPAAEVCCVLMRVL